MAEPTILLLSTSDTDLISARSSGKNYRWANPSRLSDEQLAELFPWTRETHHELLCQSELADVDVRLTGSWSDRSYPASS